MSPRSTFLAPLRLLASPALMFFALPWLMLLLVLGTVAQRYIGLYASQKLFFGSYLLWVGLIPLPGAYVTLALIAASLIAKLLHTSPFRRGRVGTLIVHISAVVLLLGGLITAWLREDGYMVLGDGQMGQVISDYRERALTFDINGDGVSSIPYGMLETGKSLQVYGLPFKINVLRRCFPCGLQARTVIPSDARDVAQKLELVSVPYSKEDAKNIGGVEFSVSGAGEAGDGTYIAFEGFGNPGTIAAREGEYHFSLKPETRALPFTITLKHFTKSDYPGTDEARAYRSEVTVTDGALSWNATIEMNQPLRYRGYTFYQSSYVEENGQLLSVLAVVKNAGEWFPYIAISMLCGGLMLHLWLSFKGKTA